MKNTFVILSFLLILGSCASSSSTSSSSSSSSSSSNVSSAKKETSGAVKFTASSPAKIEGEEKSNGHEFMYELTKKSTGNYKLIIKTYKDSHDHRTTRTAYQSSITSEKIGDKLKVTVRYSKKPNSYSWHVVPQNVFDQEYNLKTREITYSVTGNLAEKFTSKAKGETKITTASLSEVDAIKMSVEYFIRGYEEIFEH